MIVIFRKRIKHICQKLSNKILAEIRNRLSERRETTVNTKNSKQSSSTTTSNNKNRFHNS